LHRAYRTVAAVTCTEHDDGYAMTVGRSCDVLSAKPSEISSPEHQAHCERRRQYEYLPCPPGVVDNELDSDQHHTDSAGCDRNSARFIEAELGESTSIHPRRKPDC
jgi:hypothetical protein